MPEVQLPEGWVRKKLGEVCEFNYGKSLPGKTRTTGDYPVYGWNGIVGHHSEYLVKDPTIIVGRKGAAGAVHLTNGPCFPIDTTYYLGYKSSVTDRIFLYYFLKQSNMVQLDKSTAIPGLNRNDAYQLLIPLPPLPVQQAIVARIEELFSELDAGVKELHTALIRLKTYRQAVLHHYLNNPDWERVKLGEVADMRLGKMLDGAKNKGVDQPYLRNINVRWGAFDLQDLLEMRFEVSEEDKYGLEQDDLIVCEGGEPGRAAIWKGQQAGMKIQKALHRIRLHFPVKVEFFYYYLRLASLNGYLAKYFTGTTIKHLTGREFAKFKFPLPDLDTQNHIVSEIEARLSEADAMETTIRQELARAENLRQSILKQAFSGKLVTTPITPVEELEMVGEVEPVSLFYGSPSGDQLSLF